MVAATHRVTGTRSQVWDAVSALRRRARHEILSFDDTQYLVAGNVPDEIRSRGPATLRSAVDRGVAVRQITTQAGLRADSELRAIIWRDGGTARVVPRVPMKMSILDREIALFPLDGEVLAHGFRVVGDPMLVAGLVAAHRGLWQAGVDPSGSTDDPPPDRLAVVLARLAAGEPDDVAARRLGISPRSYSRRVAELLQLLQVTNRFAAGAEAVRRGWL